MDQIYIALFKALTVEPLFIHTGGGALHLQKQLNGADWRKGGSQSAPPTNI